MNGNGYLGGVYALFNVGLSGPNACWAYYVPASNALYLYNDGANAYTGPPITPSAAGSLSNSQCSIDGAGSSVTGSGNTLALKLAVTFKASFSGTQTLYGYVTDSGNLNSNWQTLGTWKSSANSFTELWDHAPDYSNHWQLLPTSGLTQMTYTFGNFRIQASPTNPPSGMTLLSNQLFVGDLDYSVQFNHQGYGRTNVGLWDPSANSWTALVTLDTDDTNLLAFNAGPISTQGKYSGTPYMNRWITISMKITGNQISFYADGMLKETFTLPANGGYNLGLNVGCASWKTGANDTSFGQVSVTAN